MTAGVITIRIAATEGADDAAYRHHLAFGRKTPTETARRSNRHAALGFIHYLFLERDPAPKLLPSSGCAVSSVWMMLW
jgi:hypothetical protein